MKPTAKQKKYIVSLGGFIGNAATKQEASQVIDALKSNPSQARQEQTRRWGAERAMPEQLERIVELGAVPVENATMTVAAMQIDGLVRALKAEAEKVAAQKRAEFEANPFWQTRQAVERLLQQRGLLQQKRSDGKRQVSKFKKEEKRLAETKSDDSEETEDRIFDLEMDRDSIEEFVSSSEDELEELKDELRLAVLLRQDFWLACFGKDFSGEYLPDENPNCNVAVDKAYDTFGAEWKIPARRDISTLLEQLDQQFAEWDRFDPAQIFFREFEKRFPEKRKEVRKTIQQAREASVQQAAPNKRGCLSVLVVLLLAGGMAVSIYLVQ